MTKLLTKFDYKVDIKEDGVYTTVTRLADDATKVFYNAGHKTSAGIIKFMESITDELAESYFPKPRKK